MRPLWKKQCVIVSKASISRWQRVELKGLLERQKWSPDCLPGRRPEDSRALSIQDVLSKFGIRTEMFCAERGGTKSPGTSASPFFFYVLPTSHWAFCSHKVSNQYLKNITLIFGNWIICLSVYVGPAIRMSINHLEWESIKGKGRIHSGTSCAQKTN